MMNSLKKYFFGPKDQLDQNQSQQPKNEGRKYESDPNLEKSNSVEDNNNNNSSSSSSSGSSQDPSISPMSSSSNPATSAPDSEAAQSSDEFESIQVDLKLRIVAQSEKKSVEQIAKELEENHRDEAAAIFAFREIKYKLKYRRETNGHPSCEERLYSCGAAHAFLDVIQLHSSNVNVLKSAFSCIARISPPLMTIFSQTASSSISSSTSTSSSAIATKTISPSNIAVADKDADYAQLLQRQLVEYGLHRLILLAMREFRYSASLQKTAAGAIRFLILGNAANKILLVPSSVVAAAGRENEEQEEKIEPSSERNGADAIQLLLDAIRNHLDVASVQKNVLGTLWNMIFDNGNELVLGLFLFFSHFPPSFLFFPH